MSRPCASRPFSVEALEAAYRCDGNADLGVCLGIHHSAVRSQRATGLTIDLAEDWCDRLGIHPIEVWGDLYLDIALSES